MRVLPPQTHCHLTALESSYAKVSSQHSTKGLLSHWCQIRQSSATYWLELWIPPCVLFSWWFGPWVLWVVCLIDLVLLMGLQSSSAPSVLPLAFLKFQTYIEYLLVLFIHHSLLSQAPLLLLTYLPFSPSPLSTLSLIKDAHMVWLWVIHSLGYGQLMCYYPS